MAFEKWLIRTHGSAFSRKDKLHPSNFALTSVLCVHPGQWADFDRVTVPVADLANCIAGSPVFPKHLILDHSNQVCVSDGKKCAGELTYLSGLAEMLAGYGVSRVDIILHWTYCQAGSDVFAIKGSHTMFNIPTSAKVPSAERMRLIDDWTKTKACYTPVFASPKALVDAGDLRMFRRVCVAASPHNSSQWHNVLKELKW